MSLIKKSRFEQKFQKDKHVKLISIPEYNRLFSTELTVPHTYSYYVIAHVLSGQGELFIDFEKFPIHKNGLYLIAPGQVQCSRDWKNVEGQYLLFEEQFFCSGTTQNEIIFSPPFFRKSDYVPYILLNENMNRFVTAILARITTECISDLPAKWEVLRSHIQILLNRIDQVIGRKTKSNPIKFKRGFSLLSEFRLLVERNYCTQKHINYYADQLNITPSHLTETIREVSGDTPIDIIRQRTLLEAKRRLLDDRSQVKAIALDLGYESTSYFIRLFKKNTGLTPTQFQRKARASMG